MDADKRCAPSKKYENGSCFTIESLKIIANKYNKENSDKIKISDNKKDLLKQIGEKLSSSCSTQTCWLKTNLVKDIDNEDISKYTFRPEGPKSKYGWLSTTDINDVLDQYHINNKEFLYLGTVPYDFQELYDLGLKDFNIGKAYDEGKRKLGLVINLDESHQNGSHWVSLYTNLDKNQIYFFDSVGKPPSKKIKKFINKIANFMYQKKYKTEMNADDIISTINKLDDKNKKQKYKKELVDKFKGFDIRYNNIQHQFKNSECGVYSINFIVRLVKGETFDEIINNVTKDDKMNECRKAYFSNT